MGLISGQDEVPDIDFVHALLATWSRHPGVR